MGNLARNLGVPFEGTPGQHNGITDVPGVRVGHCTLIEGDNVRTGVTAILPRGAAPESVFAGWFNLNGNGEMTGTAWIDESGFLDGPITLTNTHSVGLVRDAVIAWQVQRDRKPAQNQYDDMFWSLPLVTETYDGFLNDINGFHVRPEHVYAALDSATEGPVEEGCVGSGTGMIAYDFKGGIGAASRRVGEYTLGVLVQANMGDRPNLTIAGVPVGRELMKDLPGKLPRHERGSIIVIVATDAPLLPHQLKRLAKRPTIGLARTGSSAHNSSGDLFLAFSTQSVGDTVQMLSNDKISDYFDAAAEATEEAIVNAMLAAKTITGRDRHTATAIPHEELREVLRKYGRLA